MATTLPPKKNTAYDTEVCLVSQSDTNIFQTSVTLAAGDVLVYKDGVLDGNIDTLPSEIGSSGVLVLALSANEMNADRVAVKFTDAAGSEWQDLLVTIHTTSRHVNDLAYPTTAGRSIDVTATGEVGLDLDNTSGALAAAQIAATAANKIADHAIRRTFQNACDSADGDTKSGRSLLGAIAKLVNKITSGGGTLTVYEDDDSTPLFTQGVTTSDSAEPITELDTT